MKIRIALLLVCACCRMASAQKEANIWYFGQSAGLDFNTNCQPTLLGNSNMNVDNGAVSVMSDGKTGQLLLYTDSYQVWNRDHQIMPNGTFLNKFDGTDPPPQGSLIIPVPNEPFQYYLFRLTANNASDTGPANNKRLRYALIDMRLDNGRGDVVSQGKDASLTDGLAGRLTAVRHSNGQDYWVLTHQSNNNTFLVYRITSAGVGQADTVRIGSVYQNQETFGFIKASPDGRKLACTVFNTTARPFDLFDFDASTGRIANYVNLGELRSQNGVSFSPDNSKLYVSNKTRAEAEVVNSPELIRQYDLSVGSKEAVIRSGKSIVYQNPNTNFSYDNQSTLNDFLLVPLQIGPDGRIYGASNAYTRMCKNCSQHFIVINKPNAPGFSCDVQLQLAELGAGALGNDSDWPNFMQHYFNGLEPRNCSFDRNDECTDVNVQIFPNPAKDVLDILISDICFTPYFLRLINVAGQVLASYEVTTPLQQRMDVSQLPGGVYFAELRFTDRITVKRFVKY